VIDAFAGRIVGWECSTSKHTAFVERAITQAAAFLARQGNPLQNKTIHHSDAQYAFVHFTGTPQVHGTNPSIGTTPAGSRTVSTGAHPPKPRPTTMHETETTNRSRTHITEGASNPGRFNRQCPTFERILRPLELRRAA
jgi:hypothetical protein